MKTVGFNTGRGMNWKAFGLIAGLVGLYFYRRQGGNMNAIWDRGSRGLSSARDYLRKGTADSSSETQYAGVTGRSPQNA